MSARLPDLPEYPGEAALPPLRHIRLFRLLIKSYPEPCEFLNECLLKP